jgi:hypothetical protein
LHINIDGTIFVFQSTLEPHNGLMLGSRTLLILCESPRAAATQLATYTTTKASLPQRHVHVWRECDQQSCGVQLTQVSFAQVCFSGTLLSAHLPARQVACDGLQ